MPDLADDDDAIVGALEASAMIVPGESFQKRLKKLPREAATEAALNDEGRG